MSDFSDRPFAAGSLIGLRAFSVDRLGRLTGPSMPQVFTPGENEAECRKGDVIFFGGGMLGGLAPQRFVVTSIDPSTGAQTVHSASTAVETPESKEAEHTLAGLSCSCGFYAYFDGRNDYKEPSRLAALIEGYGVCTVGSRAFRASKARLVAMVCPGRRFSPDLWDRVQHNYPDVPIYTSKREALDAHPLTMPDLPTPETAEDFWTRSAS